MTTFGTFKVDLDLESGNLIVINEDMKFILLIGGDALNVLDLDSNILDYMELPV